MAEVSVIIPAYNSSKFIATTLNSVLKQDYKDMEIIVIDNGSSDNTTAIVESYGPAVRLMREEKRGPGPARNTGIMASDSEYVALLDADDIWLPNKITRQLECFQDNPGTGILHTSFINYMPDGNLIPFYKKMLQPEEEVHNVLLYNVVCPSSVMMRRSCFDNGNLFDPNQTIEDLYLWLRMISNNKVFRCLPEHLTIYRVHNESRTELNKKRHEPLELLEQFFQNNNSKYDLKEVMPLSLGNCTLTIATAHLWSGDEPEFIELLKKACRLLHSQENLVYQISRVILPFGIVKLDEAIMSQMTIRKLLELAEISADALKESCNMNKKDVLRQLKLHLAHHLYDLRYLSLSANLALRELTSPSGSEAARILAKSIVRMFIGNIRSKPQNTDLDLAQIRKQISECETQSASDLLAEGRCTVA